MSHLTDGIRIGDIFAAVEDIDGVLIFKRAVSRPYRSRGGDDALAVDAGQDDKGLFSPTEREIIHDDIVDFYCTCFHLITSFPV